MQEPQGEVAQPPLVVDNTLATISTSSTPHEITPLTTFAPSGVSEERIQELLRLQ